MSHQKTTLCVLLLLLLPAAGFAQGESSVRAIQFMPDSFVKEGVRTQVIVVAESSYSPPGRLRGIERLGDELRLVFARPPESKPASEYRYVLTAELPELPAGEYQIRVVDVSLPPAAPALASRQLKIVSGEIGMTYGGPTSPTEEEEVVVRLDHRPCDGQTPPSIDRADFHLRLRGGSCFVPAPEGYAINLGRLAAGHWKIELERSDAGLEQQLELTVAPAPAAGVVLQNDFEVEIEWRTALGEEGQAELVQPPSQDSALFYFFSKANWELMIKVLNGCAINNHYWVFGAASTDVGYTIDIRRRDSSQTFRAENPIGTAAPAITDITAFPCDPAAP